MKNLFSFILLFALASFISPVLGGSVALGALALTGLSKVVSVQGAMFSALIPIVDASALLTNKVVAVFKESISPTTFLSSFFRPVESMSKEISIAVKRGTEKVAVDISRYSSGNRNASTKSTAKTFLPPFYHEILSMNEHKLYDTVITMLAQGQTSFFSELMNEIADDMVQIRNKIERAIELQCAQIFMSGIVTLNAGTNIDFKRKAASKVAYAVGHDFSVDTVNPNVILEQGCNFLRQVGKTAGGTFNVIMGSEAYSAYIGNPIIKAQADIRRISLETIHGPERNSVGGTLHGEISLGSYKGRIWTYNEFYDNAAGTSTPYIDPKQVIILPEVTDFVLASALVPQLIENNGTIPQSGRYLAYDTRDIEKASHKMHLKSATVAVPVAVDRIWNAAVLN